MDEKPKSKRGGPRPNAGGARPGAGRPPKTAITIDNPPEEKLSKRAEAIAANLESTEGLPNTDDPLVFLTSVMNHSKVDGKLRVDAAKALLPFKHKKVGEQAKEGKKEQRANAAKEAGAGRFGSAQPPKLVVSNG